MTGRRRALAERRKAAGYSQEALAEALRVEPSTIGRWERGETAPQPWFRPKLARLLDIPPGELDTLLSAPEAATGLDLVPHKALARTLHDLDRFGGVSMDESAL